MCILCELKKKIALEAEARPGEIDLAEVAKHAQIIINKEQVNPLQVIGSLAFLMPVMKEPELMLELLVKANEAVLAAKSGASDAGGAAGSEAHEKEIADLKSQISTLHTTGQATGDAIAALSNSLAIDLPSLDGTNPRNTVAALAKIADKLEQQKAGIEFWMREITNRYDLNKSAA